MCKLRSKKCPVRNLAEVMLICSEHLLCYLTSCQGPKKQDTVNLGDKELFGHPKIVPKRQMFLITNI